jgi:hypothetical protein
VNSIKWLCAILSLSALCLPACGSDDKKDNGTNADAQAYLTSCESLCTKKDTAQCTGGITLTLADCKDLCQLATAMTGDCAAKYKAYGLCTDNASDPCTAETACSTQMDAANTACGW